MVSRSLSVPTAVRLAGVFGGLKTDRDVALRREVVDFIWYNFGHQMVETEAVGHVPIVQVDFVFGRVLNPVQVFDPAPVETAGPPNQSVNLVTLFQKKLRKVGTILTGDAGDERFFQISDLRYRIKKSNSFQEYQMLTENLKDCITE